MSTGLICNYQHFSQYTNVTAGAWEANIVVIKEDNHIMEVQIEYTFSNGNSDQKRFSFDKSDVGKFPHEMVCMIAYGTNPFTTDLKFHEIYGEQWKTIKLFSDSSPDSLVENYNNTGVKIWREGTTRKNNTQRSMQKAYDDKMTKYNTALQMRGITDLVAVTVVSSTGVLSNEISDYSDCRVLVESLAMGRKFVSELISVYNLPVLFPDSDSERLLLRALFDKRNQLPQNSDFHCDLTKMEFWKTTANSDVHWYDYADLLDIAIIEEEKERKFGSEDGKDEIKKYEDKFSDFRFINNYGMQIEPETDEDPVLRYPILMCKEEETKLPGDTTREFDPLCDLANRVLKSYYDYNRDFENIHSTPLNTEKVEVFSRGALEGKLTYGRTAARKVEVLDEDPFDPVFETQARIGLRDRSKDQRVQIMTTPEIDKFLQSRGIGSTDADKKVKNVKSLFAKTTDIDYFIDSPELWESSGQSSYTRSEKRVLKHHLRQKTKNRHRKIKSEDHMKFLQHFTTTKMSMFLKNCDLITNELCATVNQFSGDSAWLVKKVKNKNIYIIAKTFGTNKPMRFLILAPTVDVIDIPGAIESREYNSEYSIFNIETVDRLRLSHLMSSHEFFSVLTWHLQRILLNKEDGSLQVDNRHLLAHINYCVLQYFESKAKTSEITLNLRYMYNEMVKTGNEFNRPSKILNKFPDFVRSSLQLWIVKQNLKLLKKYYDHPTRAVMNQYQEETGVLSSTIRFENLFSFVNQKPVKNFQSLLFLSYLGIMRNKDEGDPHQGFYKIFSKIGVEELKMDMCDPLNLGQQSMNDWFNKDTKSGKSGHEFDPFLVGTGGRMIRRFLSNKLGSKWSEEFLRNVAKSYDKKGWHYYATLKASAIGKREDVSFDDMEMEWLKTRKTHRNQKTPKVTAFKLKTRAKCIENVFDLIFNGSIPSSVESINELLDQGKWSGDVTLNLEEFKALETVDLSELFFLDKNPMESISILLECIEKRGGVQADLFKKQQLTGPREIFILDIFSRIVINFLETISRMLCEELPVEMLSKGSLKINKMQEYLGIFSSPKTGDEDFTWSKLIENDADDKSTWCQKFTMPLFHCLFCNIFDQSDPTEYKLLVLIGRILNVVADKKLFLPPQLMYEWRRKPNVKSFDPIIEHIKKGFLGAERNRLVDENMVMMNNISNMMQGILHFTSSVLHSAFAFFSEIECKHFVNSHIEEIFQNKVVDIKPECWLVSSDDSLTIRTYDYKVGLQMGRDGNRYLVLPMLKKFISVWVHYQRILAVGFCMKHSFEKSTSNNFSSICEFNSFWMVGPALQVPTIKFLYAASKVKVTTNVDDRQRTFFELRKQIVENGGTIEECSLVQISQLMINYQCLGCNTNRFFDEYFSVLKLLKNPSLGYYLFCEPLGSGIISYSHAYYTLCLKDKTAANSLLWMRSLNTGEIDEDGNPLIRIDMDLQTENNYQRFREKYKCPGKLEDLFTKESYEYLVRQAKTTRESLIEMFSIVSNRSSSESFSFQAVQKVMSSSVYCLQYPCITLRKRERKDDDTIEVKRRKISLLGLCYDSFCKINFIDDYFSITKNKRVFIRSEFESESEVRKIFINSPTFDEMNIRLEECLRMVKVMRTIPNKIKRDISIPIVNRYISVSLRECCKSVWFASSETKFGSLERFAWNYYKEKFEWLQDTVELTLNHKKFPFDGLLGLRDFLSKSEKSSSKISPLTCGRKSKNFSKFYKNVIVNTQSDSYVLSIINQDINDTKDNQTSSNGEISFSYSFSSMDDTLNRRLKKLEALHSIYLKTPSSCVEPAEPILKDLYKHNEIYFDTQEISLHRNLISTEGFANLMIYFHSRDIQTDSYQDTHSFITEMLNYDRRNTISYWSSPQNYDEEQKKYYGYGRLIMRIRGSNYNVEVFDDFITTVICENLESARIDMPLLCKKLKSKGIRGSKRWEMRTDLSSMLWPDLEQQAKMSKESLDDAIIESKKTSAQFGFVRPWDFKLKDKYEVLGIERLRSEVTWSIDLHKESLALSKDLAILYVDEQRKFSLETPALFIKVKPFHRLQLFALNKNSETLFYQARCYNVDSRLYSFVPGVNFRDPIQKLILSNNTTDESSLLGSFKTTYCITKGRNEVFDYMEKAYDRFVDSVSKYDKIKTARGLDNDKFGLLHVGSNAQEVLSGNIGRLMPLCLWSSKVIKLNAKERGYKITLNNDSQELKLTKMSASNMDSLNTPDLYEKFDLLDSELKDRADVQIKTIIEIMLEDEDIDESLEDYIEFLKSIYIDTSKRSKKFTDKDYFLAFEKELSHLFVSELEILKKIELGSLPTSKVSLKLIDNSLGVSLNTSVENAISSFANMLHFHKKDYTLTKKNLIVKEIGKFGTLLQYKGLFTNDVHPEVYTSMCRGNINDLTYSPLFLLSTICLPQDMYLDCKNRILLLEKQVNEEVLSGNAFF